MKNKYRITLRLQTDVKIKMSDAIEADGYGKRKKAKWISEAIDDLLSNDHYVDLVELDDGVINICGDPEGIYISEKLRVQLDKALCACRLKLSHKQITQSAIVRTAILQRLLRRLSIGAEKFTG